MKTQLLALFLVIICVAIGYTAYRAIVSFRKLEAQVNTQNTELKNFELGVNQYAYQNEQWKAVATPVLNKLLTGK